MTKMCTRRMYGYKIYIIGYRICDYFHKFCEYLVILNDFDRIKIIQFGQMELGWTRRKLNEANSALRLALFWTKYQKCEISAFRDMFHIAAAWAENGDF